MDSSKTKIDLFYSSSVSVYAPSLADYLAILDKEELNIAERFKQAEHRDRYIICHGILRQLLASRVNQSAKNLRIEKTEFGKPFLPESPELSFNMSHSGDILAIAMGGKCQLGIDVECYKARNTWEGLVKKCFATEEADYWYSLDTSERSRAFYQFWVIKEAFVKAVGKGITLGLNQCVVDPENFSSFIRVPEQGGLADQWQVYALDLSADEFGALVCDRKDALIQAIALAD